MNIFENALWIWPKASQEEINQYCQFIHKITVKKPIKEAYFYISANKDYNLYVNGKFIAFGQWPDYPTLKSYDKLDVTDYITEGENRICIEGYNCFSDFCSYISDKAGIIFSIECTYKDNTKDFWSSGEDTLFRLSPQYRQGDIERLSMQLNYSFEADLRKVDEWIEKDTKNFTKIAKEDTYTKDCIFIPRPVKKLVYDQNQKAQIITKGPFIRKEEYPSAAKTCDMDFLGRNEIRTKINIPCNNTGKGKDTESLDVASFPVENEFFIVDMGETVCGHLHLDFEADEGTLLTCSYGEHLLDLRVRAHFNSHNFGFRVFAKKGKNNFTHRFVRLGGRYLEIHVTGKAAFYDARIIPTDYPLEKKYEFKSKNSLENKIMAVCENTLRKCIHDHFEDTPWREQGLYTLDSRNQSLCNYYLFGNFDYIKENIRIYVPSLTEEGHLWITAPSKFYMPIPIFTYAWIMWLRDYFLYSGDYDFVKEMLPTCKIIIEKLLETQDDTGLFVTPPGDRYWNFVEWQPGLIGDGKNTGKYSLPHNAFTLMALKAYIYMCQKLNCDCKDLPPLAEKLNRDIDNAFWVEDMGAYKSYIDSPFDPHFAQISNSLALCAGIVPEEKQDSVQENIAYNEKLIETTISMCMYKYEALLQDEKYFDYVFEDIEKQWGRMLYAGATSFWETQHGGWYGEGGDSLSHGWSAVPAYFYFAYKLGIKPISPGKFERKPKSKDITGTPAFM